MDQGDELDLKRLSPALVKELARKAAERASDVKALRASAVGEQTWSQPIYWKALEARLLKLGSGWGKHEQSANAVPRRRFELVPIPDVEKEDESVHLLLALQGGNWHALASGIRMRRASR